MSLPEGFGYVPGRSRATAIKVLAAAEEVGADPATSVRTVRDGYHVQEDVLEKYNAMLEEEDKAIASEDFAVVTTADGAQVGDGTSIVTLHDDGTATTGGDNPSTEERDGAQQADTAPSPDGPDGPDGSDGSGDTSTPEPAKNASTKEWLEFARASANWSDADAEMSRNELIEKYATPAQ